ncbi:hypothetical protein SNE40_023493 [Patella caerulea]|uniref:Transmembrane protein n=1 Tax=Patella caerulea TaxID=87958 RepID=A0AAN8GC42_PATCE
MSICLRILMLVSLLTAPITFANPEPSELGLLGRGRLGRLLGLQVLGGVGGLGGLGGLGGVGGLGGLGRVGGLASLGATTLPLNALVTAHGVTGLPGLAMTNLIALGMRLRNDLDSDQRRALRVHLNILAQALHGQNKK